MTVRCVAAEAEYVGGSSQKSGTSTGIPCEMKRVCTERSMGLTRVTFYCYLVRIFFMAMIVGV